MDLKPDGTITEEFLKRVETERQEILFAYDNGYRADRTDTKTDDSVLPKLDRFGFIHTENLPVELTDFERDRNRLEKSREKKWISMLERWPKQIKPTDKLFTRIFKGVPNSLRGKVWSKLLDIDNQKRLHSGVYAKMIQSARKYSLDLRQIDLDINRTFRDNIAYKKRYCPRQVQLFNVLAAYSIYNTEIGYCQGMSNICALLLMYLSDEEDTFWALSELMSNIKYSMHGLYKKDFPKLIRFSERHDLIVKSLIPNVQKRLVSCTMTHAYWPCFVTYWALFKDKCNISSLLYTTKWFLQCYLDALPFSLVLRIWDIFLLKGDSILLSMSYCILKTHKRYIKRLDMDSINHFLKNRLPLSFGLNDDEVILRLQECMDVLKRYRLDQTQPLPQNEMPTQPFGQFNKITRELIAYNQKKQSMEEIVENFKANSLKATNQQTSLSSLNSIDDSDDDDDTDDDHAKFRHNDTDSLESEMKHERDSLNSNSNTLKRLQSEYDNVEQVVQPQQPVKQYTYFHHHPVTESNKKQPEQQQSLNISPIASPNKNVARIIFHKNNVEFVRYQHGIYAPEKTQTSVNKFQSSIQKPDSQEDSSYEYL